MIHGMRTRRPDWDDLGDEVRATRSTEPPSHSVQTGALVRAFLAERHVSVTTAAEILGLPKSAVSARLAGRTRFSAEDVARLAAALDVEIGDLVAPVRPAR